MFGVVRHRTIASVAAATTPVCDVAHTTASTQLRPTLTPSGGGRSHPKQRRRPIPSRLRRCPRCGLHLLGQPFLCDRCTDTLGHHLGRAA
jgi:hypothetical protein